jgi:hypothetical protein
MVEVIISWIKDPEGVASNSLGNSLISKSFAEKIIRDLSIVAYQGYMQEGIYFEGERNSKVKWKPVLSYYGGTISSTAEQQKEWAEAFSKEVNKMIRPYHMDLCTEIEVVY